MRWHKVGELKAYQEPGIMKVTAGGKTLCLVHYQNEIFALGSRCPHAGADLSRGWCTESKLVCPIHRFSYDLKTGRGSPGQNDFIESYPVKIKDGSIYVGINSFWEKFKQAFK